MCSSWDVLLLNMKENRFFDTMLSLDRFTRQLMAHCEFVILRTQMFIAFNNISEKPNVAGKSFSRGFGHRCKGKQPVDIVLS